MRGLRCVMPQSRHTHPCHHLCFPGLMPLLSRGAKAGLEKGSGCQQEKCLQQGGLGRVLILGSHLGHLPCVQQGQVPHVEGSIRAGNSCLLTATSTASTQLAPCLLVGGLHLPSHTFPPYLHMGTQGVQESIHAPSLTVVLWWNEVCTVGHHQGSPKAI